MEGPVIPVGWTDAQWSRVVDAVTDEARRASVASAVFPCYGPAPEDLDVVRRQTIQIGHPLQITIDDVDTTPTWLLEVPVRLRREQVRDEGLSSALLAFRRAANLLAIVQDALVFHGDSAAGAAVSSPQAGLVDQIAKHQDDAVPVKLVEPGLIAASAGGPAVIADVEKAIRELSASRHSGPFTCVLGNDAFFQTHVADEHVPVLPAKRIERLLNGPLLRCGSLASRVGLVVARSAEPIDLVMATPPQVQFLQIDASDDCLFRVYARFVLRVKDRTAVYVFQLN